MTFIAGHTDDYKHTFQPIWINILIKQCILLNRKTKIFSYMNPYLYFVVSQNDLFTRWPHLLQIQMDNFLQSTLTNILFVLYFTSYLHRGLIYCLLDDLGNYTYHLHYIFPVLRTTGHFNRILWEPNSCLMFIEVPADYYFNDYD